MALILQWSLSLKLEKPLEISFAETSILVIWNESEEGRHQTSFPSPKKQSKPLTL